MLRVVLNRYSQMEKKQAAVSLLVGILGWIVFFILNSVFDGWYLEFALDSWGQLWNVYPRSWLIQGILLSISLFFAGWFAIGLSMLVEDAAASDPSQRSTAPLIVISIPLGLVPIFGGFALLIRYIYLLLLFPTFFATTIVIPPYEALPTLEFSTEPVSIERYDGYLREEYYARRTRMTISGTYSQVADGERLFAFFRPVGSQLWYPSDQAIADIKLRDAQMKARFEIEYFKDAGITEYEVAVVAVDWETYKGILRQLEGTEGHGVKLLGEFAAETMVTIPLQK